MSEASVRYLQMLDSIPRYPASITVADLSKRLAARGVEVSQRSIQRDLDKLSTQPNGTFTGADETGCVINGTVTIPEPAVNVFNVAFSASNCGSLSTASSSQRNGSYEGFGAFDFVRGRFEIAAVNDQVTALFSGVR